MDGLSVIVDRRERNGELLSCLEREGVGITLETLPVGDYAISDRVCIERKTVQDFESSIMSGRMFDQLGRLRESYEAPIVLIEGNMGNARLSKRAINGAIAAIYVDYGIEVVFSGSATESAEMIAHIAAHEQEDTKRMPSMKGGLKAHSDGQFREYVIGNLPGVGPKTAKTLLQHFGTVRDIANADVNALMKIENIGRKKAESIERILKGQYTPTEDATNNYMSEVRK